MRARHLLPVVVSLSACVQADPAEEPASAVHLDITDNLYDDAGRVDLGDLTWGTGRLATDAINDVLRNIPFGDTRMGRTDLFGLEESAADDLTIRSLPEIATGLATRFGETTLPAQVAAIRRRHLEQSDDQIYAETEFRLGANFDHGFHQDAPGLSEDHDSWIGVGFDAGVSVSGRVVAAHPDELDAVVHTPLAAVGALRGFVMPRDVDDIRAHMKPGESMALAGRGRLGLNFGVGVPLLVANPLESVTYSVVLSAGASTLLSGELDVQLVRLEGDEAVIDVGLRNARVERAFVRVDDSFGISGLVRSHVTIGSFDVDLGRVAERALERELNRRLSLIAARAEGSTESARESVSRFRIDLAHVTQAGRVAIEEALKGDVRLAQSLANRHQEGLTAEVDLVRAGRTTYGHLGLDLLGMRFFTETERQAGDATLQTPGGALSVMFDSLRHESGSWFSEHGYARSVLAGVEVGADGVPRSQTNVSLSWKEGDDYMQRDKMLDHLDALLMLVLGAEGQAQVTALLDEIGRATQAKCAGMSNFDDDGGRAYRACKMNVLTDRAIVAKVDLAKSTFETALSRAAPEATAERMAREAFHLALAAVRAYEPAAQLAGPPTNVALSAWLSDAAVTELMSASNGTLLQAKLRALEVIAREDRDRADGVPRADRGLRDDQRVLDSVTRRFDEFRTSYLGLVAIANTEVDGVGVLGDSTLLIDIPVSDDNRLLYDDLLVRTVSRRRVEALADMIDKLIEKLGDIDDQPERLLGPALVALLPAGLRNVQADVDMNLENNWAQNFPQYTAAGYAPMHETIRGPDVRLIGADLAWDVSRLVDLHR